MHGFNKINYTLNIRYKIKDNVAKMNILINLTAFYWLKHYVYRDIMNSYSLIIAIFLQLVFFISTPTHASSYPGTVKFLDVTPKEVKQNSDFKFPKFKLKNGKIIFFTDSAEDGLELWTHKPIDEKIEKYFSFEDAKETSGLTYLNWDDDKIVFWHNYYNKWYVTDGTKENTRVLTEVMQLPQWINSWAKSSDIDLKYIKTLESGKILIIHSSYLGFKSIYIYDPSSQVYKERPYDYKGYRTVKSIGKYLFYQDIHSDLWRLNLETLESIFITKTFSVHSSQSNWIGIDNLTLESPLTGDIYFQKFEDETYTLHIIDKLTGEIQKLPIESDSPIGENVIYNKASMYVNIFSGYSGQLLKINLNDYSYKSIDLPKQENYLEYGSYESLFSTEKGVLISASVDINRFFDKECDYIPESDKPLCPSHLYFLSETGEKYLLSDNYGPLNYGVKVQGITKNSVFLSVHSSINKSDEYWEINLETLKTSRINHDKFLSRDGYLLNNTLYVWDNNYSSSDYHLTPTPLYKLNMDTSTLVPIHYFANYSDTTHDTRGVELFSTKAGFRVVDKNTGTENDVIYGLSEQLDLAVISEQVELSGSSIYSNEVLDELYIIEKDNEIDSLNPPYFLATFDPILKLKQRLIELPVINQHGPNKISDYDGDNFLISYRDFGGEDYTIVNLESSNVYSTSDNKATSGWLCNDYIALNKFGGFILKDYKSDKILLDILKTKYQTYKINKDNIVFSTVHWSADNVTTSIFSLNCETQNITEHITYSDKKHEADDAPPILYIGEGGWLHITSGKYKNVRVNVFSNAQEPYRIVPELSVIEDEDGFLITYTAEYVSTKKGLYGFFRYNNGLTEIYKIGLSYFEKVAELNEYNGCNNYSKYDPYDRIFLCVVGSPDKPNKDLLYFSPIDNKLHSIDIFSYSSSHGHGLEKFTYTPDGYMYIVGLGKNGSEIIAINLNCLDIDDCNTPFPNSPPVINNEAEYSFNSSQKIYIPVIAFDPDRDSLVYKLENAPSWLKIEDGMIQGVAPATTKADINDITLIVTDVQQAKATSNISLKWQEKPDYPHAIFNQITIEEDATPPSESSNEDVTNKKSNSSGGAFNFVYLLLIIIFMRYFSPRSPILVNRPRLNGH